VPYDFVALPKAEVHVHLEGSFEIDDIVRLAKANGVPLPRPKVQLFQFSDGLSEFLAFLDWICGLVQNADQMPISASRENKEQNDCPKSLRKSANQ
jgi:adenosine deaminase